MSRGGFEVLVQLVMAASTTEPFLMFCSAAELLWGAASPAFFAFTSEGRAAANPAATWASATRSCGRRGPARLASTVPMSSSTTLV